MSILDRSKLISSITDDLMARYSYRELAELLADKTLDIIGDEVTEDVLRCELDIEIFKK